MRGKTLALLLSTLTLCTFGCSPSPDNGGTAGSSGGGSSGSAGSSGAAGTTGSGGTTGSAGTTGSGGSSGGGTGAGGSIAGSGGSSSGGSGGAVGSGGSGGSGGAVGSGGSGGSGGAVGSGGSGGGAGSGAGGSGTGGRGGSGGGTAGSSARGGSGGAGGGGGGSTGAGGSGTFTLTSPMHMDGAKFDGKYTCNGGNLGAGVIPELDWTGVPANTKSFALTFIDTTLGDTSAMGQHWAMYNIPWNASTGVVSKIPEGTKTLSGDLATAKQVAPLNNGAFLSPCAQSLMNNMDDQYAFTLYALSTDTLPGAGTSVASVVTALKAITPLGKAVLTGHAGLKGK